MDERDIDKVYTYIRGIIYNKEGKKKGISNG
jgi:hypothetical protein